MAKIDFVDGQACFTNNNNFIRMYVGNDIKRLVAVTGLESKAGIIDIDAERFDGTIREVTLDIYDSLRDIFIEDRFSKYMEGVTCKSIEVENH